jgi:hypothetical protein
LYSIFFDNILEDPVTINENGIKLNPQNMVREELYHCIYQNHIFLFFKDNADVLHCYEIDDINIIRNIKENPENIHNILNDLAKNTPETNDY